MPAGIALPSDLESFSDGTRRAYDWLAKVRRTPEVDRKRYITHWLEEAQIAGFGTIRPDELLTAARIAGDIVLTDGPHVHDKYLGICLYSGRAAASVSLDAPVVAYVAPLPPAHKPEPVFVGPGESRSFSGLTA